MAHFHADFPWLLALCAFPLLGALACLALRRSDAACRVAGLVVSLVVLGVCGWLFVLLGGPRGTGWLLHEDLAWIPRLGARLTLGLDGLSLVLVLLTACLVVVGVLVSWRREKRAVPLFYALLLTLESGILGVFLSLDLLLFYLFWEIMLIPMFFLIGIWGHERRVYAAVKFFLFTLAGSLLMLLAILGVYLAHGHQTGEYTFALAALQNTILPAGWAPWLYAAFLLAFAVKVPLVPLHTWLPDAHTEAPTAGSVILAGLLLKTGVYGLIRFGFPLFPGPARDSLPWLAALGLAGLFWGAWVAFRQQDAKRLVAYSSVSHMGLVVLGLAVATPIACEGSFLQMLNHGLSTGALFALVGMIAERAGTRRLDELGGLWARAPVLAGFFLFFALAAMGLPGLNNFAGEFLVLVGAFRAEPWLGALGAAGMVFAAAYMLRLMQGVLWGPPRSAEPWRDLSLREGLVLAPLAVLVLWLGTHPATFQDPFRELARVLAASLGGAGGAP
ncbi:MAG TPA: NADH-quinone oxidoreductase subunit M [Myxococcota bacterium]|nr:NADH-quinone oxidoreductase subunit M [Myxococcota bacterium]HRY92716.1 NADH-quinone oxidoreductase subunit M [Myxococcota bacterium]HSA24547.1 NADH-quinone oxidoreductase subunit M [Myxococcota bacterium]